MSNEWGPPRTKTELVKLLREHADAFCRFGYRPTEIRLPEPTRRLWVSGKTFPAIKSPTGLNIEVNVRWVFYNSVLWDAVEYVAIPPSGGRARRTSTYLTPPQLSFAGADLYYRLRSRRIRPEIAVVAAEPLIEVAAGPPGHPGIGTDPAVDLFVHTWNATDVPAKATSADIEALVVEAVTSVSRITV